MARRSKQDTCEVFYFNEEAVQQVKKQLLPLDKVFRLAETFKTMGDPTRISIIQSLSLQELCVCDLAAVLEMSQSSVSHQLRILRNLKLVKFRKEGKMVYYSLDDEHIINLFREGLEHVQHNG
ncbi:MAG: metalloregulator ArsR/SmtB family transcription factor [Clostridia bacterium]|nr:metalloregulator ArsR/SmtB family transcription factor [Clostridia bacterium]